MYWQFFISGYLVLGTISYLLRRKLAQTMAEYNRLVNAFFFIAALYPIGLIVASFSSPDLTIGWLNLALLLAGSISFPLINLLSYRASKDVDAGLYTVLSNLTPIITIVTAWILLNEKLNEQQLLGAVIIIISAFLVTLPRLRHRATSKSTGLAFALGSFLLLGLATTFERYMLTRIDFGAYLVFGWGAQTLWMIILAWPQRRQLYIFKDRKLAAPIVSFGFSTALKGLCFVSALNFSGNASLVSAFGSFMAVLVVLAAFVFLKEKEWIWFKLGAAAIGTAGLIILNTA